MKLYIKLSLLFSLFLGIFFLFTLTSCDLNNNEDLIPINTPNNIIDSEIEARIHPTPRYHEITFKASHNSYERNESIGEQLTFNASQPYNDGCLGLEFDIWRNSSSFTPNVSIDEDYFKVKHYSWDPSKTLAHHLQKVKAWHNQNPNHLPVLITIDIKSSGGGYSSFHDEIDTYIKVHFDENLLFKPNQLIANGQSLAASVATHGWPLISSMRGKFIFCLSGNEDWKSTYANTNLSQRLCFSDENTDVADSTPPTSGNIVFFNFHIYNSSRDKWMTSIPQYCKKNMITRVYIANSEDNFNNSIKAKVSAIATDKIRNHSWAKVSDNNPYLSKMPCIRSIKNVENNEYRANRATQMQGNYESPKCDFIFESYDEANNIYALRNGYNNEYLDCSITSMAGSVWSDCQLWKLIPAGGGSNRYYIKNEQNGKYLTKRASKLASAPGSHEIHILQDRY